MSDTNELVPGTDTDETGVSERTLDSRRVSIRWRLTLWYAGSLCVLLAGFGVLVWTMTSVWLLSQSDLELTEELAELLDSIHSSSGADSLSDSVTVWSQLHEPYGFDFEIRSTDGLLLLQSARLQESDNDLSSLTDTSNESQSLQVSDLGPIRVKVVDVDIVGEPHRLWISVSQVEQQQLLHQLASVLLVAGLVVMAGAGWGGWMLARRVLRPIDEMTSAAARISASQLGDRVPIQNPHDELGRLAQTLNTMLDRLDESFAELKRFTADAAHELRTPLTLLRNELEVTLRKPRSAADYEKSLRSSLEDAERISRLAEQLLELARDDASRQPVTLERVPLVALLTDVVSQLDNQARSNDIQIELPASSTNTDGDSPQIPDDLALAGDCLRLHRLFVNLIDNAVKYSSPGGFVRIHCELRDSTVRVTIEDSGCGIPAEHHPHVFNRFYRIDNARTSSTGGTGLGLAICRSIVESHGGSITLKSEPNHGTRVTVELPDCGEAP